MFVVLVMLFSTGTMVLLEPCRSEPCSATHNAPMSESSTHKDEDDANVNNVTISQQQFLDNSTDVATANYSGNLGLVINNQTLISSFYKNVTEEFLNSSNLNFTLTTESGAMTLNNNSTATVVYLPDDISDLSCAFLKEFGSYNIRYKYTAEELKQRLCKCTGYCLNLTLSPGIKKQVHSEIYGALSDSNRPIFITVVTVYSFLLLVGLTGNMTTIIGLLRWIKNSTPTFVFIVSLSVSDLLLLCICMPLKITEYFRLGDIFTEATCKLSLYVRDFTLISSVLTLTVISFERYYAICHPLSVQYRCTWNRARTMMLIMWCISACLALPTIFMTKFYLPVGMLTYECLAQSKESLHLKLYFTYYLGVLFVLPLLIMTFTYGRSCIALWRSTQVFRELQGRQKKFHFGSARSKPTPKDVDDAVSRRKVIKLLIIVVIIFMCCWGPPLIVQLLSAIGVIRQYRDKIRLVVESLTYVSSALNPYLFIAMSSQFRATAFRCLKRFGRRRRMLYQTTYKETSMSQTTLTSGYGHSLYISTEHSF